MNRIVSLLVLASCSPIDDKGNTPPDAPPDNEAPRVVMSNPGDGSKRVPTISNITFWFDGPLDETTVNADTVKVRGMPSQGYGIISVYGTVTYDPVGYKLTFDPARALYNGYQYTVTFNGVKDVDGNTLTGPGIKFATSVSYTRRSIGYNSTTGNVSSWTEYTLDANGYYARYTQHSAAGPDLLWMTTDDPISYLGNLSTNSPEGRVLESKGYNNGPNGIPGDADDQIISLSKYTYDAMGLNTGSTTYNAPGPNMTWGDGDDLIESYSIQNYNANGQQVSGFYLTDPGANGMWKDNDDRYLGCATCTWSEAEYDAQGYLSRMVIKRYGTDQIPKTADDDMYGWYSFTYVNGYQSRQVFYDTSGPNGIWLDSDDHVSSYSKVERDPTTERYSSWNAGPDSIAFNADDVCLGHNDQLVDVRGLYIGSRSWGRGPDNVACNADDIVSYFYKQTYDTNGNPIDSKSYAAGPDKMMETADDRVTSDADYDLDH